MRSTARLNWLALTFTIAMAAKTRASVPKRMSYAIMFSAGEAAERGFIVKGEYDVALKTPRWGWKTVFEVIDADHLTITAYKVSPDGQEAKAVETKYVRATHGR